MKRHKVSVVVEGREVRVSPDSLTMTSEDEIHWGGEGSLRFTVEFDGAGPFANRVLGHDEANSPKRPTRTGRFKYTVALESDPTMNSKRSVAIFKPCA